MDYYKTCKNHKRRGHWADLGVGLDKTGLKKIGYKTVDWIHLAQDTDRWWPLVTR
jgi:hypothetical protein